MSKFKFINTTKGLNSRKIDYLEKKLVWILSSFQSELQPEILPWQYPTSRQQLLESISAKKLVLILNNGKPFPFNYLPQQNDFLLVKYEYIRKPISSKKRPIVNSFISFIYNEKWKINQGYDHLYKEYKTIAKGEIKYL